MKVTTWFSYGQLKSSNSPRQVFQENKYIITNYRIIGIIKSKNFISLKFVRKDAVTYLAVMEFLGVLDYICDAYTIAQLRCGTLAGKWAWLLTITWNSVVICCWIHFFAIRQCPWKVDPFPVWLELTHILYFVGLSIGSATTDFGTVVLYPHHFRVPHIQSLLGKHRALESFVGTYNDFWQGE